MNELRRFRWVALLEGFSFVLLLFFAMPLKYWAGFPIAVRIVGMVHGVLFLAFIGALFQVTLERGWRLGVGAWLCWPPSCPSARSPSTARSSVRSPA